MTETADGGASGRAARGRRRLRHCGGGCRGAERVLARPSPLATLGERLALLRRGAGTCTTWTSRRTCTATGSSRPWSSGSPGCSARRPRRSSRPARWPSRWRCAAGRAAPGNPTVALHPLAHPEVHERRRVQAVSGLRTGPADERAAAADGRRRYADFDEPFGTLMLELPLRDAGFVLPSWDELTEVVEAARERDAVVHFDGARLWESTTHFGRPLAEIAALADSVYVSFYKSLGGFGGAALAGPEDPGRRGEGLAAPVRRPALPAVPDGAVGAARPGAGAAPAAGVRGPRARGRRRAARGVRGGGRAVGPRAPGGAAHPRVPGLAAVRGRRRSTRRRVRQAEETDDAALRRAPGTAGGPGLAVTEVDGARRRPGVDGGGRAQAVADFVALVGKVAGE